MGTKKNIINNNTAFYIFTAAFFIGLIVPILIQDGMFIDGLLYTSVSKNLANGIGSFWFPKFDNIGVGGSENFHEQPPLVFAIQAFFFKVLGNSIYTERIYSFFTACVTALLIIQTWRMSVNEESEKKLSWLPVFLWIITPIIFWSFSNNVHENTMGIFTLLAVYFVLSAMYFKKRIYLKLMLAGLFIFLAAFSKGVPGLFPLTTVVLYALVFQDIKFRKVIAYSLILLAVPVMIFASLIILIPEAGESLSFYFFERLVGRVNHSPTVDNRFLILYRLFMELIPSLIVSGIIFITFKIKKIIPENSAKYNKKSLFFLLIGLSGSAPLVLTMVQRPFYFSHSIPFFAISFALFIVPLTAYGIEKINPSGFRYKIFLIITTLMLVSAIAFSAAQYGKTSRQEAMLEDVYAIGSNIPNNTVIGISQSLENNWSLKCYFVRHFNIGLSHNNEQFDYFLKEKGSNPLQHPNYKKMPLDTKRYDLYRKE